MSAGDQLGQQFHEMTSDEFAKQPGTWFHGSPNGQIGAHGGSFHVGSELAAAEALGPRIATGKYRTKTRIGTIQKVKQAAKAMQQSPRMIESPRGGSYYADNPGITAGRIDGPMTNTTKLASSRGPGRGKWEVRQGIPRGALEDWKRHNSTEPLPDIRANAVENGIRKSGRTMRQGMYYVNAAEGAQEDHPISAILPNRKHFKTHEDYLVEARAQGKSIPKRAMKGYSQIPGQGRLF